MLVDLLVIPCSFIFITGRPGGWSRLAAPALCLLTPAFNSTGSICWINRRPDCFDLFLSQYCRPHPTAARSRVRHAIVTIKTRFSSGVRHSRFASVYCSFPKFHQRAPCCLWIPVNHTNPALLLTDFRLHVPINCKRMQLEGGHKDQLRLLFQLRAACITWQT